LIVTHLDPERLLASPHIEYGGSSPGEKESFRLQFLVNDPRGVIAWEAFDCGRDTEWAYWHDEFHVCMSGAADVEFTLPPNHSEILHAEIRPGDAVLILAGTRARFHVPDAEPYIHVSLFQPRYEYADYLLKRDYSDLDKRP
jgi:mannose-6-phosphate isomerase-like protein (cupin superfamily)